MVAWEDKHHNPAFPELLLKERCSLSFVCCLLCRLDQRTGKCDPLSPWQGPCSEGVSSCVCWGQGCTSAAQKVSARRRFSNGENLTLAWGHMNTSPLGKCSLQSWWPASCSVGEATSVPGLVCSALQLLLKDSSGVYVQVHVISRWTFLFRSAN